MMIDVEQMGTIDWILLEFRGKELNGELAVPILDLVNRHLIRLLDMALLVKDDAGELAWLTADELDPEREKHLGAFSGASSGLLTDEDAEAAAEALDPGCEGLLLIYENLWSKPFATAARRAGGQLVASGRIPVQAILAQLDALEA
jgi:Family of unknown function (DUF6325)